MPADRVTPGSDSHPAPSVAGWEERRPWVRLYDSGQPAEFEQRVDSLVELSGVLAREQPEATSLIYHEATLSFAQTDALSHAFATALVEEVGVRPGDRIAFMLQNVPQFPIALQAAWLVGAIVTPVSPMAKRKELLHQLNDSGATVLVCLPSLFPLVVEVQEETEVRAVVTASPVWLGEDVPAALVKADREAERERAAGPLSFEELVERYTGARVPVPKPLPSDPAMFTYTSGTTGVPKGAINTHGGIAYNAEAFSRWVGLDGDDVTVAMAPLFHVTGIVGHFAASRWAGNPLLLSYRFDAGEMLRLIERWKGSWMLGPLTAYLAMLDHPDFAERDLSSLTKVYSGGAPVLPSVVRRFEGASGLYLHNMFGMTEATAPTHGVPLGRRAPVDEETGALAIGVPIFGVDARIVSLEDGSELPPGESGELVMRGPMVVPGYWNRPEESAHTIRDGWLHSGDVAKRDEEGWFYLVDRVKDLINASGYKVWPREVEDVLSEHPAVLEASVVGVPDDYRGETVCAHVVLRHGASATTEELVAHCREVMAVFKVPREVLIVEELPKTASGKVLRRALRERRSDG